ncbi:PREDICTED: GTP-binding protein At3g49725, chloroplastic isoform X2 [Lupinus angustifolius]|uniref:GTP-binding protein At3g49725, chloroplastic isoform X2 n=1 Tax=Lupinus angustifolius TaxID=3871 RepID=UPI00092F1225|nr:PREDICTED: GTP-binding protein At3g49725, chloroplastic isoform X2 [Lupinus angustifolius]
MLRRLCASLSPSRRITSLSPYSNHSHRNHEPQETTSFSDTTQPPKLFVVQPRLRPEKYLQAKLNEAMCLANSLEEQRDGEFYTDFFDKELPPHILVQNPSVKGHKPRADTYFGHGTVDNIKCHLNAVESKDEVDAVFVNTILSGVQQRNLERAWNIPVLDRVGLIIEIFNAHAFTKEAKLQAELAALSYKKSRLVRVRGPGGRYSFGTAGEAEVVSARGRGGGGQGFTSGAGETELQLQRRRILERRNYLLSQIEEVRRTRAVQRAGRKRHGGSFGQGLATVAVVGYTNAGKSTLVSELSNSELYSDCRLFATVDPRLRSAVLPSGRKVLLSDTVGFISDLPIQLVEAFHATLEEVVEADLLVHVVDSSAPNLDEHRSTVLQVLQQIGVSEEKLQNMIEVWNKIDIEEECLDVNEDEEKDDAVSISDAENEGNNDNDNHNVNYEAMEEKEDYSDGWLYEDTLVDEDDFRSPLTAAVQQNDSSNENSIAKNDSLIGPSGPHVKTSAIMGVGLQELLGLIDNKLSVQDKKLNPAQMVESSIFNRKWRPSQTQDSSIVAEQ